MTPAVGLDGDIVGNPSAVRAGEASKGGGDLAGHEIELSLPVLGRVPDVEPVVVSDPAVERNVVGQEAGEELTLDGHRRPLGNAGEQVALEDVDARIDRVRLHLGGVRLFDETKHAPGWAELDETVRRRIGDREEVDGGSRPAFFVEGQHRGQIDVREDVAVQHEDAATHQVDGVPHASPGPERLPLHRVPQADAVRGAITEHPAHLVHHVGAGQHHVGDAVAPKQLQLVREKRHVQERDDGLRRAESERPEPRALAAREDDGGYLVPVQGSASLMSMTGIPSRTG